MARFFVVTFALVLVAARGISAGPVEMLQLPQPQPTIMKPHDLAYQHGIVLGSGLPSPPGSGWGSGPAWNAPPTPSPSGWSPPVETTTGWPALVETTTGWPAPETTTGWPAPETTTGWSAPETTTTGWSVPETEAPGWSALTSPGWLPPAVTTTVGWSAPTTTLGWSPPPTSGWSPPPTSGWSPPPTSGWSISDVTVELESEGAVLGWGAAGAAHSTDITVIGDDTNPAILALNTGSYSSLEQGVGSTQISSIDPSTGEVSTVNAVVGYNSADAGEYLYGEMSGDLISVQNEGQSGTGGEGVVALAALTEVTSSSR